MILTLYVRIATLAYDCSYLKIEIDVVLTEQLEQHTQKKRYCTLLPLLHMLRGLIITLYYVSHLVFATAYSSNVVYPWGFSNGD